MTDDAKPAFSPEVVLWTEAPTQSAPYLKRSPRVQEPCTPAWVSAAPRACHCQSLRKGTPGLEQKGKA